MDIIYRHPTSGGAILQSGAMEIPGMQKTINARGYIHAPIVFQKLDEQDIALLALTAHGFQPRLDSDRPEGTRCEVLYLPFHDSQTLDDEEVNRIKLAVRDAAGFMAAAVKKGQRVLSTCWAGINRSSLLTAYTLKNIDPTLSAQQIIDIIRQQRHAVCLNNELFERIVRDSLA